MANNPKIKVDADLSSFGAELEKLKQDIGQLSETLKSQGGKEHFNFKGSSKELNALIAQAEKLTAALDKGDKKTAQYAKNLKAAKETMEQAAKVALKLEEAGTAKTRKVSNYFGNYSADLAEEHDEVARAVAQERERSAQAAKYAASEQARLAKWAGRASKFIGFAGGNLMGGGGGYSTLGAGLGSMLPGPLGMIGGTIGGMIGGAADKFISPAREEAKTYSELRRSVGSTATDFEQLRDSLRSVIDGMGVTDNEAANLAKQFAHTASLTGDATDTIARGISTSTGFAQGYGISTQQSSSFFASMRLSGAVNNDKDSRRLAMMIGESVQRGGTSAKMDEVLASISGFVKHSTQQMLTAANGGQYSSYLASLTGSKYAGLKGDPNNAAALMSMMDAGVASGGTMGEASQFHWLQARQAAFKGMSAMDNSLMQTAGATGDLSGLFAPGSPSYDNASAEAKAQMDRTRQSILASGFRNNFEVGMAHIKAISGGDSYLENANFRGMFGGNPQQAAALMLRMKSDPGLGGFEKELGKYGINLDNVNVSQISALSELVGGGDQVMARQYEKLLGSGKLSKAELDAADKTMAEEGYGEGFKKMLLKLTEKYDTDDGLRAQTTQIDISNRIQEKISDLVSIETDVREYILRLLDRFGVASPVFDRMVSGFKGDKPISGQSVAGGSWFHGGKNFNGSKYMEEVDDALKNIGMAGSQKEKDRLYTEFIGKMLKHPENYPSEAIDWARNANGITDIQQKRNRSILGVDTDKPTIPSSIQPAYSDLTARLMNDNPGLKDFQAAAIVGNLAHESGNFKTLQEQKPLAGRGGYGWAQWTGSRRKAFEAYARRNGLAMDSDAANYGFLNEELKGSHNSAMQALLKTGNLEDATRVFQDKFESPAAGYEHFNSRLQYANGALDQMPAAQRKAQGQGAMNNGSTQAFRIQNEITLLDRNRNMLAEPFVSLSMSGPLPAGF
jgi:hypothetical protein